MALRELIPLAALSVRDPRRAARALLGIGLPVQHYWTAFLAVTVLAALMVQTVLYLAPPPQSMVLADGTEVPLAAPNALQTVALIGGGLLLLAGLLHLGARAFGGTGRFAQMVLAMTWLQAVLIGLNLISIPLLLIGLGGVVEVVLFAALFWMLGGFTAGIQGFDSTGKAVMAIIGGLFALALALSILLVALGGGA
ncbi:MAG: YIP1 family protein [Hasllibacter sp.]